MGEEKVTNEGVHKDPKFQLLVSLKKKCYAGNGTNSEILSESPLNITGDTQFCARTFDGFSCWDETPGGAVAFQKCPNFIMGFDPKRMVYKNCSENGTWFKHPATNRVWTNYTSCVDLEDLEFRTFVNDLYVTGYSISVTMLVLSLIIFIYFRNIRCTRIRVHMHLFASIMINNVFWIIWYKTVVNSAAVIIHNKAWCQMLHVLTHYFMTTGYCWMFCESLHLHLALVVVFVKEKLAMRCFMIIGWGISFIIVAVYSLSRLLTPGGTDRCWIEKSKSTWIIIAPVGVSLVVSFGILINVARILFTKLRPIPNQGAYLATKKTARAALILIPLFGLHFLLIPVRPQPNTTADYFYEVFSAFITSLQGACVSILFCFTNHEVITAFKIHFARYMNSTEDIPMTRVTGGESLTTTRENVA